MDWSMAVGIFAAGVAVGALLTALLWIGQIRKITRYLQAGITNNSRENVHTSEEPAGTERSVALG